MIHVGCRDRIVKLVDLDGDGMTDRYDIFNDDHQVTEHFHEFAMGLETDVDGNLYYAKSVRHALPAVVPHHGMLLKVMFGYHDVTDDSDAAMRPPAFWITNAFDRSPAELLRVKSQNWSPLDGRLLELSYGEGRVHLVLTEPAAGEQGQAGVVQGGMVALPIPDLPTGIMRGRFNPADEQLYAVGLDAWAGNRQHPGGFFRVRRTERPVTIPVGLHAELGQLKLEFAEPLDVAAARRRAGEGPAPLLDALDSS